MKRLVLPSVLFALSFPLVATEGSTAAAPVPAPASSKSADAAWRDLERLQQSPEEKPVTRQEALAQLQKWFEAQKAAAATFAQSFPDDPRSWQARMIALRATMGLRRFGHAPSDPAGDRKILDEIINAPGAPAPIKAEATFNSAATRTAELDPKKPETYTAFYQAVNDALEKYPDHPLAGEAKTLEMQVLNEDTSPAGAALLQKLISGSDPRLAESAKNILAHQQLITDLKTKPLDLKYKALDGHDIDTANLRGKVVLLDFWASWCGPCIEEMPNLVSAYQQHHDQGLEILGISLDDDQDAMEKAIKIHGLAWPQRYEADHKIPQTFGVETIPSLWLFDKKGLLRQTGLRGPELAAAIEKLLAE